MSFLNQKLEVLKQKGVFSIYEASILASQSVQTLRKRIADGLEEDLTNAQTK